MPIRQLRNLWRFGRVRTAAVAARRRKPRVLRRNPHWEITNLLDFVIAGYPRSPGDFFFIQVGAFDGQDDLSQLIRKYRWRGILVEPQADAFRQLQANYADQPQLQFFEVAIGPADGEVTLYTRRDGDVCTASLEKHLLIKPGHGSGTVASHRVPCWTIPTLLQRAGVDGPVDLLQVDTEGLDFEIIRSLDLARFRPAILRFEHALLSERDRNACLELLASHGYRFLLEDLDVTAICDGRFSDASPPAHFAGC